MISTLPSMWLISALPFGIRASNSSSTRGRPAVMSSPATPPVWNVRMVSCAPGSPIDCARAGPHAPPPAPAGADRPHGPLRAGLADRLRRDDPDRLARADHLAGGEVAAVAGAAGAAAGRRGGGGG